MGGLQAKSMTSYRAEPSKMAGMRYHGTVMTTTRWGLYIIKKTIITRSVYTFNSKSTVWACYRCILHLQQYSHRLNLFFWGSRRHLPHLLCSKGPNYQRGVLLISASAIEGYFEGITQQEGHQGRLVLAQQCPGSLGTCNPEETGLPGLPLSLSPTIFFGSGPVGLPPVSWTEKTIESSPFFVRCGGHCCCGDLVGQTNFWIIFEWLAKVRATG